jgi:anhydro-N-acetylmuramic acid kinase
MNGTSLDAIDYSLIESDSELKQLRFIKHKQKKIPGAIRQQLLLAAQNQLTTYDLSLLHYELGRLYARQLNSLKKDFSFDVVGLHGQTVHHQGKVATLQIGHPAFLKEICNKPIYYDFRAADIAAHGQGAPFAPFLHRIIGNDLKMPVAFHNLGGISNLTYLNGSTTLAFDTGPANILMDSWIQFKQGVEFDRNGQLARQGLPDPERVNAFLKHPFFRQKHPKSTGREEFNLDFIKKWGKTSFSRLSLADQMATLTELSAVSICNDYRRLKVPPHSIYFYGGGVKNQFLMKRLAFYLDSIELKSTDELGWPSQALEASAFALLALARHLKIKVHLRQVTGAKSSPHLGSLYF